ncbi:hypothetical protein CBF17_023025 [Pantoea agglomerans]|uniref:hypothetical protein n=1 Tax=Enterobacter agglomerans TaxID=549 RepID=UPI000C089622|nr:hypothetical protein [Pantoea agglomerans]PHP91488.1 hypothetical protein CBF17_023025 [Pantoea agglomerans]
MGPLCLYAQTCEISSLIEEYCKQYGKISPAIKVLKEMINNRPVSERQHLNHLLFQYKKQMLWMKCWGLIILRMTLMIGDMLKLMDFHGNSQN